MEIVQINRPMNTVRQRLQALHIVHLTRAETTLPIWQNHHLIPIVDIDNSNC